MPKWSPVSNSGFQLVFNPGQAAAQRIPFSISESDIEDALDYGRVERHEPFDKQLSDTAYHMVLASPVPWIRCQGFGGGWSDAARPASTSWRWVAT